MVQGHSFNRTLHGWLAWFLVLPFCPWESWVGHACRGIGGGRVAVLVGASCSGVGFSAKLFFFL